MNSALLKWVAAINVTLVCAAILLFVGGPASAAIAPGTVIVAGSATLPAELSSLATGKRIAYTTTALGGGTATATGLGVHGQYLFVDPVADVVIVKCSAWPTQDDERRDLETITALRRIADHFA